MSYGLDAPICDEAKFQADIDLAKAAGFEVVRTSPPAWALGGWYGGNGPDNYYPDEANWRLVDSHMEYIASKGMKVCLVLNEIDSGSDLAATIQRCSHTWPLIANRWGSNIRWVQILNERNESNWLTDQPVDPPYNAAYLEEVRQIIQLGSDVFHEYDQAIEVTTNTYGYPPDEAVYDKWKIFYDAVSSACDVIGLDVYPSSWDQLIHEQPSRLQAIAERYQKPVVIMETGDNATSAARETEAESSLPKMLRAMKDGGATLIVLYELRDVGPRSSTDGEERFGIYYQDRTPKPYLDEVTTALIALKSES